MLKEIDRSPFPRDSSRVFINPNGKSITLIDVEGRPFVVKRLEEQNLIRVRKRRETLKRKTGPALIALRPIMLELATGSEEWQDTPAFSADLWEKVDKNPFFVDGESDETFRNATNFLLQKKGQDLNWIAEQLLADSKIRNFDFSGLYEEAKSKLIGLIKSKNPDRFSGN